MTCDRCGRDIYHSWYFGTGEVEAGNCTQCNDNLCAECAGSWDEDGRCKECQINNENCVAECDGCIHGLGELCNLYHGDSDGHCRNFDRGE